MMAKRYNLTWDNFMTHGKDMLKELWDSQVSSDVTMVSDDNHKFKAHKLILSSCNPLFKTLLEDVQKDVIIYLTGMNGEEIQSMLQFIYLGEATSYNERMDEYSYSSNTDEGMKEDIKKVDDDNVNKDDVFFNYFELNKPKHEIKEDIKPIEKPAMVKKKKNVSPELANDECFSCKYCEKKYPSKKGVTRHIRASHDEVGFPCEQCLYKANSASNLRRHIQVQHEGVKYQCDQCDYQTPRKDRLKEHVQSNHYVGGPLFADVEIYSCQFCDKKLSSKVGIKKHIEVIHNEVKFSCDQCLHQTTSLSNLKRHIQDKHDAENGKYQCDQCEYKTHRKDRLRDHMHNRH